MSLRRKTAHDPDLRRRWRVALAHAELTESEWARERGLTPSHVRQVTAGDRESAVLEPEIRAFIAARERMIAAELQVIALEPRRDANSRPAASAA